MRKILTILVALIATVGFYAQADCYIVGNVNNKSWNPQQGVQIQETSTAGVYSGEIEITGAGYFGVADMLLTNDDWSYFNANCRYNAESKDMPIVLSTEMKMTKGGTDNSWKAPLGFYTVTVNFNNNTIKMEESNGGTVTPTEHTFCLVGTTAGWDLSVAPQFTKVTDNTWEISIDEISGEFLVVRNGDWNQACRSNGETIIPDTPYVPLFGNGGEDSNIMFIPGVSYTDAKITLTETASNTYSILFTADNTGGFDIPDASYSLVGQFNGWVNDDSAPKFTDNGDGVYTIEVAELEGDFLILRDNNWEAACRSNGSDIQLDMLYAPTFGNGGEDSNLSLPVGYIYKGVTITLTMVGTDAYTLLVTAESREETELPADTFCLVGTTTGWDLGAAPQFTLMSDGVWSLYLSELSGEFKVVRNGDWTQSCLSNGEVLVADMLYTPGFGNGGEDSNISLPNETLYKGVNITLTQTGADAYTILLTAESTEAILPPADTFTIVGEFNNWDTVGAPLFTDNGDKTWSVTLGNISGEFLILRNGDWNQACRTNGQDIVVGVPYVPAFGGGGEDSNISLPEGEQYLSATITITETGTDAYSILINADKIVGDEDVYELTGEFNGWELGTSYFEKQEEGRYTLELDRFEGGFKVIKNGSFDYQYGAHCTADACQNGYPYYLMGPSSDAEIVPVSSGEFTDVVFTLTIDEEGILWIQFDGTNGIDSVEMSQTPVYYNLQGIEVANPQSGSIYIVRRGAKVTKEIIK